MRLIDADELLEILAQNCVFFGDDNEKLSRDIIEDSINEATTIDAEPVRHGHWIECESENGIHFHKCSECGKRDMYQGTFTDWNKRGFSFYYKRLYCPVCGAKMGLEE